MFTLFLVGLLVMQHTAFAASGVEDMLTDFSTYMTTRVIPIVCGIGLVIGAGMMAMGNPKGQDVVKGSIIGAIIGIGGPETIRSLFF